MSEPKAGDVVRLKSGGPSLVVRGPTPGLQRHLNCMWFNPLKSEFQYEDMCIDVIEVVSQEQ